MLWAANHDRHKCFTVDLYEEAVRGLSTDVNTYKPRNAERMTECLDGH